MTRPEALAAATALALVFWGILPAASAESYFFRSKGQVSAPVALPDPSPFAFSPSSVSDREPGATATSAAARMEGHGRSSVSISGEAGAEFQTCPDASCAQGASPWGSQPVAAPSDLFYARVRVTAGPVSTTRAATLSSGGFSATFAATSRGSDETPDTVWFTSLNKAAPSASVTSDIRRLVNHDGVRVSAANAEARLCSAADCSDKGAGGWTTSALTAARDDYVQMRMTAPAAQTARNATLTYGTASSTWYVQSKSVTCAGASMRLRLPSGYEALVCGWTKAPTGVKSYAQNNTSWNESANLAVRINILATDNCSRLTLTLNPSTERLSVVSTDGSGCSTGYFDPSANATTVLGNPSSADIRILNDGNPALIGTYGSDYTTGQAAWSQ